MAVSPSFLIFWYQAPIAEGTARLVLSSRLPFFFFFFGGGSSCLCEHEVPVVFLFPFLENPRKTRVEKEHTSREVPSNSLFSFWCGKGGGTRSFSHPYDYDLTPNLEGIK